MGFDDAIRPEELDDTLHGSTELRVHGVSGTPPDTVLDHPAALVRQLGGDSKAGFYRRWYPGGTTHDIRDKRHREAYSWGGLTSGPATRALWVLLLPFTLVNLGHWMLPPAPANLRRAAGAAITVLRLLSLTFTLTLMVSIVVATMDIGAWQCGAVKQCAQQMGPLRFIANFGPGPRLAMAAAIPTALIFVLGFLGRAELRPLAQPPDPAVTVGATPLANPSFWAGDQSLRRQRAIHMTAWAAGLSAILLIAPARYADPGAWQGSFRIALVVDGLLLVAAIVFTCMNSATGRGGDDGDRFTVPIAVLRGAALAMLAAGMAFIAAAPATYPEPPTHLPGLRPVMYLLLPAQAVLLLVLFTIVWRLRRPVLATDPPGYRPALRGFGAPCAALAGWLLGGAFTTGVGLWIAKFLGEPVSDTRTAVRLWNETLEAIYGPATLFADRVTALQRDTALIVPPAFFWVGLVSVGCILLAAIGGVVFWRAVSNQVPDLAYEVAHEHPGELGVDERAKAVARVRAIAAAPDRAGSWLGWVLTIVTIGVIVAGINYQLLGYKTIEQPIFSLFSTLGVGAITAFTAGLVSVAYLAFRNAEVRRKVGIVWDITTFWPRANHPLTPPCYGERAVPELVARVAQLSTAADDRVVISAHSQGSVVALAAVLQMKDSERDSTSLVTYGSPLRRLYARFFPAYFGLDVFNETNAALEGRWRNIWAPSDPIGGWIFDPGADGPDRKLADPTSLVVSHGKHPQPCGHSGYLRRPEYFTVLNELLPETVVPETVAVAPEYQIGTGI